MKIAVIGTGGVGGYLGAKLWKGGNDLTFVARGEHLAAMKRNGLLLKSPDGDIRVGKADFRNDLRGSGVSDLIIFAVKSFDTPSAAAVAREAIGRETIVLTIQNGVENERLLAESLGRDRIVGGVACIASTIQSPGVIFHEWGAPSFKIGEMDGTISPRCLTIQDLFRQSAVDASAVENILRALWEKWIFICGAGGMTAYTMLPMGRILEDPSHRAMLEEVIAEATSVARARGIDAFTGFEEKAMAHCGRLSPTSTSSMYYDVTHGKRNEVEALNGAAVRFGKELGIPTPANETIYEHLRREGPRP